MDDKIFDILSGENPTKEELQYLENLASKNSEVKKIISDFNAIKNVVKNSSHIGEEVLGEYVLLKNNKQIENKHLIRILPQIEAHLRSCAVCREAFAELNEEYADLDNYLSAVIVPAGSESKDVYTFASKPQSMVQKYSSYTRIIFASVATICVLYLGLFIASEIYIPSHKEAASFSGENDFYASRGLKSESFQRSLAEIENENYDAAIIILEDELEEKERNSSGFYIHYILGLTYIKSAESDFIGFFESYNPGKVEQGIEHLLKAIEMNNTGNFQNISFNAYYYIGKAYLLIDRIEDGKKYLNLVIENKGSHLKEAEDLINRLEKM